MIVKTYSRMLLIAVTVAAAVLQPAGVSPSQAQRPAKTLYEQAKQAGGKLVKLYDPDRRVVYQNLNQLAARSDAVVVGLLMSHRPQLSPDGQAVSKDARVRVQGALKGDVRPGTTIQVRLAGGGYPFPDGTFVYAGPKDFRQPQEHTSYVFFLKATEAGYEPVSETQALFALKPDGKVEPAETLGTAPLVMRHRGQDGASFLLELREAVRGRQN